MRDLIINGVSDRLYRHLQSRARRHGRSLNNEVLWCLEQATRASRVDPEALLAKTDGVRERLGLAPLTEGAIRKAKESGRP